MINQWMDTAEKDKHPHRLNRNHIDNKDSKQWLVNVYLFPEIELCLNAIQSQVKCTRNYY